MTQSAQFDPQLRRRGEQTFHIWNISPTGYYININGLDGSKFYMTSS